LHNFDRIKRYTASAHSPKTKLGIMLDFHCNFVNSSGSILILCDVMLQTERRDYYDN